MTAVDLWDFGPLTAAPPPEPGPGTARQAAVSADDLAVIQDTWQVVVTESLAPALAASYVAAAESQAARLAAALPAELAEAFAQPLIDTTQASLLYASEATNRLVAIGDELWANARTSLVEGMAAGEDIPKLAARVRAATQVTLPRATVIARTETIGARNAGSYDEMVASGVVTEKTWLATNDRRTRPDHRLAGGLVPGMPAQTVPIGGKFSLGGWPCDYPGDPALPPEQGINCVVGTTRVGFGSARAVTRRWYEGDVVTIRCASGDQITVTPNHPVLRADGRWVAAHLINEGDYCIRAVVGWELVAEPNEDGRPSQISEIYRAARQVAVSERVALTPPDLHGDGGHGQVEVVPVYGQLAFDGEAATDQQVQHLGLALANLARPGFGRVDDCKRPVGRSAFVEADFRRPSALVGSGGQISPFGFGHSSHPEPVGFRSGSRRQTQVRESSHDGWSAGVQVGGHSEDALPGVVSATQVVKVDVHSFAGHVYNLDTGSGWYSANSIVVRNCRCTLIYQVGDDETVSQVVDSLPTTAALWAFHLPGKHDQSTHGKGNWRGAHTKRTDTVTATAATPITGSRSLGGGWSASTKIEEHEGGTLVRKDFPPGDHIRNPQDQADAERLGSLTASAMGVNAPAVAAAGPHSVVMEHVPGKPWSEVRPYGGSPPSSITDSDQGRMTGLFDIVTGNPDRNSGNVMVTDESGSGFTAIDHSLAFSSGWSAGTSSPFAQHYINESGNNWADSIDVSPSDMGTIRTRLDALSGEFVASGRGDWHDLMMERLDVLAPLATGTTDRL